MTPPNPSPEDLAQLALAAWNNVSPEAAAKVSGFLWKDFPEDSKEAWRRVVLAISGAQREATLREAAEVARAVMVREAQWNYYCYETAKGILDAIERLIGEPAP